MGARARDPAALSANEPCGRPRGLQPRQEGTPARPRLVHTCFFFNDTAPTEIYTLSLHDALPISGLLNPTGLRDYARELADATGAVLDGDEFPVVLGGDCSILLGNLLALRRRARYGLLFIDGHADFYQPEANVNGEAASSELALATGRGPEVMAAPAGYRPLIRDEDVVAFAHRDAGEAARYGSQPLPESLRSINLETVRRVGAEAAARQAMAHLERDELTGFWIHLDAD